MRIISRLINKKWKFYRSTNERTNEQINEQQQQKKITLNLK